MCAVLKAHPFWHEDEPAQGGRLGQDEARRRLKPHHRNLAILLIEVDDLQNCAAHPKEESVLYCTTCESLACVLCAYGAHKQHNISLLTDASDEIKLHLHNKAEEVIGASDGISQAIRTLQAEIFQLKEVWIY